jgi:hypothetical protein
LFDDDYLKTRTRAGAHRRHKSGLAQNTDEALDQAFEALKDRLPQKVAPESVAAAARRLATFGKRHGLSLGGLTIKELLRESRP